MDQEASLRSELRETLKSDFEVFEEEWVTHPLFKKPLRVDLLASPRHSSGGTFLAFEVKLPDVFADIRKFTGAIGQAASYVHCNMSRPALQGRVVRTFIYPAPEWAFLKDIPLCDRGVLRDIYLGGMAHSAGAAGVGFARLQGRTLQVSLKGELICDNGRWRQSYKDLAKLSDITHHCGTGKIGALEF